MHAPGGSPGAADDLLLDLCLLVVGLVRQDRDRVAVRARRDFTR
jgi:hypothetical protein